MLRLIAERDTGHHLAQIIHEGFANNLEVMTNGQFPLTNPGRDNGRPVEVPWHHLILSWSLVIGIWSFPQDSRVGRVAHGTPGGPAGSRASARGASLGASSATDTASWCSPHSPLVAEELKPLSWKIRELSLLPRVYNCAAFRKRMLFSRCTCLWRSSSNSLSFW